MPLLLDLRVSAVVSDAVAVGSSSAVVSDAAPERQNRTSNPRRRNVPRIPEIPLFVSQMGQKFHGDPNCRGLRNAPLSDVHAVQIAFQIKPDRMSMYMA